MKLLPLLLCLAVPFFSSGQCKEVVWPSDPGMRSDAESNLARYTDEIKTGNMNAARAPIAWMLSNNPEFNESLYINGLKVYSELLETTGDNEQKAVFFDSLMLIYDLRIEKCGDHGQLIARKAYDAYKHTVKDTDRLMDNLRLFDLAFDEYGSEIGEYMLLPYMSLARYNFKPAGNITEDEMTQRYETIQQILTTKSTSSDLENSEKIADAIDDIYFSVILGDNVDCATITEKLGPRLQRNPEDVDIAKQVFSLMVKNKCTDDPLWLEASEIIVENDPNFGLYKIMGQKFMGNGDIEKARINFNKAAEIAENADEKSEIYLLIGNLYERQGAPGEARSWYQKSIQEGSSAKDAYNALGYLYYRSSADCMEKENQVKDRAIFILAHEMFLKAGNGEMAAKAKEQFPSKVEIFERDYSAGDPMKIDCWVQREVKLQTRD
ncbi:MAG: tetratricopeptide repeat protein [Cyclobacteriaceae bacterium]